MALIGSSTVSLTDRDLTRLSNAPFNKAKKMEKREVLGKHGGNIVIAEYLCSDLCTAYTTRVIYYELPAGPECTKHGGVIDQRWIPMGIAVVPKTYCVPAILIERPKGP